MYCYFCAQHHPGGTDYGNTFANGICRNCGIGVCLEHGQKATEPGAPLLCLECAKLLKKGQAATKTPAKMSGRHINLN
jgi:hypothetical protein